MKTGSNIAVMCAVKNWVLALVCLEALTAGDAVVRVIGQTSGWFAHGRELSNGDRLSGTAAVIAQNPGDLILDCGRAGWLAYACTRPPCRVRPCAGMLEGGSVRRVDPDARGEGVVQPALRDMLTSFLRREPGFSVPSGECPDDAVVAAFEEGVDWAPALDRMSRGRYCFRVLPLPGLPGDPGVNFTLDWDRARQGSGRVRVGGLQPGTYALETGTPSAQDRCVLDNHAGTAWVAIVPEGNWTKKNQVWRSYKVWLSELERSGVSPGVVATVRRAVLAWLADTLETR